MNGLIELLNSVQARAVEWIVPAKSYLMNQLLGKGVWVFLKFSEWGVFDWWNMVYAWMYRQYTPSICYEFISSNGDIVSTQYNYWHTGVSDYAYLIYTNQELKSILPKSIVDKQRPFYKWPQKPIKPPFGSAGITYVDTFDETSDMDNIEFKTSYYNYYIEGNIINKCTLTYFLRKHYPSIKLLDKYTLTVLTHSFCLHTYDLSKDIVFKDD
jgi:hypothetical protein